MEQSLRGFTFGSRALSHSLNTRFLKRQTVVGAKILSNDVISELQSTLRSMGPTELADVLRDALVDQAFEIQ